MNNFLISIVMPVYNAEKFLKKTIDSVIQQTYDNWELILIDDGSIDNSGVYCDEMSVRDKRIKSYHKLNGGVSSARNEGIKYASGEWICFVDSDDTLLSCYLQNYVDNMESDVDILVQSFQVKNEIDGSLKHVELPDMVISGGYKLIEFLEEYPGVHNGFIWHRLFKSSIICGNNIGFVEGISFAEDGWFFFEYMRYVRKSKVSSDIGYTYYIRKGSLTTHKNDIQINVFKKIFEGYFEELSLFVVPKEEQKLYYDFLKKYAWRLAENWFVRRGYCEGDNEARLYMATLMEKYQLNTYRGASLSLRLLISALSIKKYRCRNFIVKYVEIFRILVVAIKNRI